MMEQTRLTADVALFATSPDGVTYVLLIRRAYKPFAGCWALPGGHVEPGEETEDAARRELAEETGLSVAKLVKVDVYAASDRDPRGRYVTFAYSAVLPTLGDPVGGSDAKEARWWPVIKLRPSMLAFDHYEIIDDALTCQSAHGM